MRLEIDLATSLKQEDNEGPGKLTWEENDVLPFKMKYLAIILVTIPMCLCSQIIYLSDSNYQDFTFADRTLKIVMVKFNIYIYQKFERHCK